MAITQLEEAGLQFVIITQPCCHLLVQKISPGQQQRERTSCLRRGREGTSLTPSCPLFRCPPPVGTLPPLQCLQTPGAREPSG